MVRFPSFSYLYRSAGRTLSWRRDGRTTGGSSLLMAGEPTPYLAPMSSSGGERGVLPSAPIEDRVVGGGVRGYGDRVCPLGVPVEPDLDAVVSEGDARNGHGRDALAHPVDKDPPTRRNGRERNRCGLWRGSDGDIVGLDLVIGSARAGDGQFDCIDSG